MTRPFFPSSSLKGTVLTGFLVLASSAWLMGCPVYGDDHCDSYDNCHNVRIPVPTPDAGADSISTPDSNASCPVACSEGYACNNALRQCQPSDCRSKELICTSTQSCKLVGGAYSCVDNPVNDCSKTGCIPGYECKTLTNGTKRCESTDPKACVADDTCQSKQEAGSLCLGGHCTAPKDLCSDSSQCASGTACADGRCVPKCSTNCAPGYSCESKTGLCTPDRGVCTTDAECGSNFTCVNSGCVEKCAVNGACSQGRVCVAGGCVVDDRPNFYCDKDGTKDGTQDTCATGSICLHHNCYVKCVDGNDTTTCAKTQFPVCKSVTTSSGTNHVCGSSTSFGTECDPTTTPPKICSTGKICFDGFCK